MSNSSHICMWHIIRKTIDCFDQSILIPSSKRSSVLSSSLFYRYSTIILFFIGLCGNGFSIVILFRKSLRKFSVYRSLSVICILNIFYLILIVIRHNNIYKIDIRLLSVSICRLHSFLVAYFGHLCSWQLCSMSIERVHDLLSLKQRRSSSWLRTFIQFLLFAIPLCLFDAQLVFNYGLNSKMNNCYAKSNTQNYLFDGQNVSHYFQRALKYPINITLNQTFNNYPSSSTVNTVLGCVSWNIYDAFIYAIIPFTIMTIGSVIIILKVCQTHRATVVFGRRNRHSQTRYTIYDNLSFILISINISFLLMTSPFNFYLIINAFKSRKCTIQHQFINELLRTIQNAYHALNFFFYCVVGKKFRDAFLSIYAKFQLRHYQRPRCCSNRSRMSRGIQMLNITNDDTKHKQNLKPSKVFI
ncbi:unnamed protein product [Didymodactylos carnosus]|uniref:G-protein coupled receptors family 1 profile domain-containing protein n=1 Tax=Didymodactylos carnosus TaxID=1234261 RepID=A0A815CHJ1_9BILA|nr:unnamed protein product [Didymodactylos carnosus]CAF1324483.1 unnamed protein product [Didymodactylos carnosus]CAF4089748.1 unnamed protein product [Didymodactylos carnosus]CAF4135191.1 unnamed protein product [Didymodactylos carnosus]